MLDHCWVSVADDGPTMVVHCASLICLQGMQSVLYFRDGYTRDKCYQGKMVRAVVKCYSILCSYHSIALALLLGIYSSFPVEYFFISVRLFK